MGDEVTTLLVFANRTTPHDLIAAVAVSSSVANTAPAPDLAALDVMDLYIEVRDMSNCWGCHSGEWLWKQASAPAARKRLTSLTPGTGSAVRAAWFPT